MPTPLELRLHQLSLSPHSSRRRHYYGTATLTRKPSCSPLLSSTVSVG